MTATALATVSPQAAQQERIQREQARRSLIPYSRYISPWYSPAPHHVLVARYLEQVAAFVQSGGINGIGRLMIFEPPRHGKTEQAARKFPGWALGRMPDIQVLLTSYGLALAEASTRQTRNDVISDKYRAVFGDRSALDTPVALSDDSQSKSNWSLAAPHRGGMMAAGVGGGITGHGAHIAIIDDPFKNREEAESEAHQEKVWKWYSSSLYTRLEDHAAMIVMHTRWHQNDLAGKLLKAMASGDPLADKWMVLNLPALAYGPEERATNEAHQQKELNAGLWLDIEDPLKRAPGAALWEEKYNAEALARIKANLDKANPLDFPALYQQQPRPAEGVFFQRTDFEIVERERLPEGLRWVRYVDLALSEKKTADFNATAAVALHSDGTLFIRDMLKVRGWVEFKEQLIVLMLSDFERGVVWGIEDVAFQLLAFMELMNDKRLVNVAINAIKPEGDKVSRARPLQARGRAGRVKLVRGAWNNDFIEEAVEFPNGRHDDQIDTVTGGVGMLAASLGPLVYGLDDDE